MGLKDKEVTAYAGIELKPTSEFYKSYTGDLSKMTDPLNLLKKMEQDTVDLLLHPDSEAISIAIKSARTAIIGEYMNRYFEPIKSTKK